MSKITLNSTFRSWLELWDYLYPKLNSMFTELYAGLQTIADETTKALDHITEKTSGHGVSIDGSLLKDGTLTKVTPHITTPVATVVVKEYGDGKNMVTELTLDGFIVGAIPAEAAALGVGNIVAAFPDAPSFHIEDVYYQELQLQLPGTPVNADLGLGSVIASGAVSVLSGTTTFEDRVTGQTNPTAAVYGSSVKTMVRMAATGISVNLNNSVKNIFLNAAGTWNVNNAGNLLAKGKILIKWTKMN